MLEGIRAKIAKFISPKAYYTGGQSSGAKYNYGVSTYAPATVVDHYGARQQARAKLKDSTIARGFVERSCENVVGKGLRVDPSPVAKILGISDEEASEKAEYIKLRFEAFAKSKQSTISETESFNQLQYSAHFSGLRDGEFFARLTYSKERGLQSPLKSGLIDPQQIKGDAITTSTGPIAQDDGIVRDASGRETGYKVWIQDKNKPFRMKSVTVPAKGRGGRVHMIHSFKPEYAGQGRGYTRLFHAIQELENIVDFQLSTLKQAINQSNIFASIKPSKDAPATNPFVDMSQEVGGSPEVSTQASVKATQLEFQYQVLPEATLNTSGSTLVANLGAGEGLELHGATVKGESYAQYQDAIVDYLAPSLGMPAEVLKMKFGNNYSASRATLLLYWNIVEIWREELATDLLNPVYESWLSEEIASGKITLQGWSDPVKRAAWLNCAWIGSPMPNIDPAKTAKANKDLLEVDATTAERIAKETNGSDANVNKVKNDAHFKDSRVHTWQASFGAEVDEEGGNNEDMDEE